MKNSYLHGYASRSQTISSVIFIINYFFVLLFTCLSRSNSKQFTVLNNFVKLISYARQPNVPLPVGCAEGILFFIIDY